MDRQTTELFHVLAGCEGVVARPFTLPMFDDENDAVRVYEPDNEAWGYLDFWVHENMPYGATWFTRDTDQAQSFILSSLDGVRALVTLYLTTHEFGITKVNRAEIRATLVECVEGKED